MKTWGAVLMGAVLLIGSSLSSPVPRAGWTGLALLPAWISVPFWTASCWRNPQALLWGLRGLAGVLASVSVWALVFRGWPADGPAAMPLGHHNLLAAFLLPLMAMVSALGSIGNRRVVPDRALASVSLSLGLVALMATGSLAGGVALLVTVSVFVVLKLLGGRRHRGSSGKASRPVVWGSLSLLVVAALTLITVQLDRIQSVLAGADSSLQARMTYWQAGLSGFWQRPWLGWGPGSVHWTLAEPLDPRPGINPPGQVVADLHSLPLQMLYELGLLGCVGVVLLIGGLYAAASGRKPRRWRLSQPEPVAVGAMAGLVGAGIFSLSGFPLDVPALPMALMPCFAVWVPTSAFRTRAQGDGRRLRSGWIFRVLAWGLVIVLVFAQGRRDLAHGYYDQALTDEQARPTALQNAVALDPRFPLYSWQLTQEEPSASIAWGAAEDARGLAVFWLTAGDQQEDAGLRLEAWLRSADLDPLSAPAYFLLATGGSPVEIGYPDQGWPDHGFREQRIWVAKALLLEPLLVAAVPWFENENLLVDVAAELADDPTLDVYWRQRLLDLVRKRKPVIEPRTMGLKVDAVPSESLSLFAFRRQPWSRIVTRIPLDPELASSVDLNPDPIAADRIRPAGPDKD